MENPPGRLLLPGADMSFAIGERLKGYAASDLAELKRQAVAPLNLTSAECDHPVVLSADQEKMLC